MFKKIYRAMVVARVGSAAARVFCNMTDRQLADAGIDRRTFPMDPWNGWKQSLLQQMQSNLQMCLLKIQMWSLKPLDVLRMIKSPWTLAYWKSTSVLLDIKIRRIAHEKAPCF